MVGVGDDDIAGGRHHFGRQQRVDGEAVFAHHVADAAAQRQAADADAGGIAEADDEAVLFDGGADRAGGVAGAGPDRRGAGVDVDAIEVAQVDDQPALGAAVAHGAVAAAADGDGQIGRLGEVEDGGDIGRIGDADDRGGMHVEIAERHHAQGVIAGIARRDHVALEGGRKHFDLVFKWKAFVHFSQAHN